MTDGHDGSGQMPRRSTRVGDGGAPVTGALAIVLAVVAVVAGFLILRSISDGGEHCPTSWTGAVSDDWFNPGNWTNGVPHQDLGAIIPFIANEIFPVINQAGAMCSDIELKPGTHLTIQPTGMLTVGN